jgi:hypothetical protein
MRRFLHLSLATLLAAAALSVFAADPPKGGSSTGSAASAAKSPQAAAYFAWVKAVKAKDFEAWKKVVPADAPKQLEAQAKEMGKKPADVLEFMGMMTPEENTVTGVKVDGSKATLSVVGKTKGESGTSYGSVQMILEGGSWRIGKQSWEVKEK